MTRTVLGREPPNQVRKPSTVLQAAMLWVAMLWAAVLRGWRCCCWRTAGGGAVDGGAAKSGDDGAAGGGATAGALMGLNRELAVEGLASRKDWEDARSWAATGVRFLCSYPWRW